MVPTKPSERNRPERDTMNPPTTLCPYCNASEITIAPNWYVCRTCKKEWPRPEGNPDWHEGFIATNQRIQLLQDIILEQQETISNIMQHFEGIRENQEHIARDLRTIYSEVIELTSLINKKLREHEEKT